MTDPLEAANPAAPTPSSETPAAETPSSQAQPTETQPPTPALLETDILGEPWVARRLPVEPSPAAPGADHAVLVHQRDAGGRHARAVLYIHGRNDYFFQTHLADTFLAAGYEFYALDLRTCGRAGINYPSPHDVRDLRIHDEEIAAALHIIRAEHGHAEVVLNGHSTGGLQSVIWAADHPGSVEALVLNSPWLNLRGSALMRSYGSALVDLLSRYRPEHAFDEPGTKTRDKPYAYVESLHRQWGGEWDWDLALKPAESFPVRAGFIAGVRRLHREIRRGLGIEVPILVCCSTTTGSDNPTLEEARTTDVVLSVEQIVERSAFLGQDVTVRQFAGGAHDLALSPSPSREEYLTAVVDWLAARLG